MTLCVYYDTPDSVNPASVGPASCRQARFRAGFLSDHRL